MPDVRVPAPAATIPCYVAEPEGDGPVPGVIVLHDVLGMTDDLRRQADWLAGAGFLSAAPNLFHWGRKPACLWEVMKNLRARRGRIFDDVDAVRRWLAAQARSTGRIGVAGFCMGGDFALLTAAGHGFSVTNVNYGRVPKDLDRVVAGACPVVASYGGKDRALKGAAGRLERALEAAGVAHDVKEYPAAGHGFMNRHDKPLFNAIGPILGMGYEPDAEADSRRRIVEFFDSHLRDGTGAAPP
jgi:carboxymethylenebutenolidase